MRSEASSKDTGPAPLAGQISYSRLAGQGLIHSVSFHQSKDGGLGTDDGDSKDGDSKEGDSFNSKTTRQIFGRRSTAYAAQGADGKAKGANRRRSNTRSQLPRAASGAVGQAMWLRSLGSRPLVVRLWYRFTIWFANEGAEACEQLISLIFLCVVPYQLAFERRVELNQMYVLGYALDVMMILCRLPPALLAVRTAYFATEVHRITFHRRRALRGAVQLLLVLPYDLMLWGSAAQPAVPYLRLSRLVFAPAQLHSGLKSLERSQLLPFTLSRFVRLLIVLILATHYIGCLFARICRMPEDAVGHYGTAPWRVDGDRDDGSSGGGGNAANESAFAEYIVSGYWSIMSLTTTGHVDIIELDDDGLRQGQVWEYCFAISIVIVSTFVYIYVNANCTSLMLKLNTRLEQYRARLQGVELYLKRNQVSKDIQRAVKRHFKRSFDEDQIHSNSHAVLEAMPRYLRRTVLQDIHMRTVRRAPLFVGIENEMLAQICAVVRRVAYHPEELLCKQGDLMNEMYILESGQLILVVEPPEQELVPLGALPPVNSAPPGSEAKKKPATAAPAPAPAGAPAAPSSSVVAEAEADEDADDEDDAAAEPLPEGALCFNKQPSYRILTDPGTSICEVPVLFGLKQPASVEAVKMSTLLVLQKADFMVLAGEFPDSLDKIHQAAKLRLAHDKDDATLEQIESLHGLKSQQQIAQLSDALFAASTGELDVVRSAITDGNVDQNERDFEQRTILHAAASAGQLSVVKLLVDDFKVALNRRDLFGRTPLGNAVSRGHGAVAQMLVDRGAELGFDDTDAASALCDRARQGLLADLRMLVRCGASVNAADYDKRSCLHLAASEGLLPITSFLLDAGASVNVRDRWGGTPLRDAVREGHHAVAKLLCDRGAELLYSEIEASGELCELARKGNFERLRLMVACGCDVKAADYDLRTALHLAASEGNAPIVEYLIDSRADVNAKDRWGGTPLSDAIKHDHGAVATAIRERGGVLGYTEEQASSELCELARAGKVEALGQMASNGVQINAADYDKRTALHLAASEGNKPVVEFLLDSGAHVNAADRWGGTPLRDAIREGHDTVARILKTRGGELGYTEEQASAELCELARAGSQARLALLVECGASANAADYDKRTALHLAASEGNKPVAESLLEVSADINARDRWGGTPLRDAVREGHHAVATLLRARGGELGYSEVDTSATLCELARAGSLETLKLTVASGAHINAADYDKRTALHLAAVEGNKLIVEYLVSNGADINARDRWGGTPLTDAEREGHQSVVELLRERGGAG